MPWQQYRTNQKTLIGQLLAYIVKRPRRVAQAVNEQYAFMRLPCWPPFMGRIPFNLRNLVRALKGAPLLQQLDSVLPICVKGNLTRGSIWTLCHSTCGSDQQSGDTARCTA